MLTPLVVELTAKPSAKHWQERKALRASRSAQYIPYRRRSATGAVRVATAVVAREGR